jgi:hypothetical protein
MPRLTLDQFIDLLLREPRPERERWIRAHARACYRRLRRQPAPPCWTYAVVVGGKIRNLR